MGGNDMTRHSIGCGLILLQFAFLQIGFSQTWKELFHTADSIKTTGHGPAILRGFEIAQEALDKAEREFGASDSNVASSLDLCTEFLLHVSISRPSEAQTCAERSLEINKKVFGPDHPKVANTLALLAFTGSYRKDPQEGMILLERARSIYEHAGCSRTKDYASVLHNIAFLAQGQGRFTYAGSMFSKALDLCRQILPPEDPDLAYTLTMYAVNYWNLGLFHEAEPLLREALHVWQTKYGEESMQSGICLGNLAQHYALQGKLAESRLLDYQSDVIFQRNLAPDDPYFANALISFGSNLMACGKYDEAVDSLTRAVRVFESMKEMSGRIAMAFRSIGECYFAQHSYALAEATFLHAIALADSISLGIASKGSESHLGLARTFAREKKSQQADSLFLQVVAFRQKYLGPEHLSVAYAVDAYAECARLEGAVAKALKLSRQAIDLRARNFVLNARMMSEQDARSYAMFLRRSVDAYLSSYFDAHPADSSAMSYAARVILSTKGQATEQALLRQQRLVTSNDSTTMALADKYRYVKVQLSRYYIGGLKENTTEGFRRRLDSLEALSNDLESALARRGEKPPLTDHDVKIESRDIASVLPAGSALVEYMRYNYVQLNPDTLLPRYLALVIRSDGRTGIVQLGEVEKIDQAIEQYRRHFNAIAEGRRSVDHRDETAYRTIGRNLRDLVWRQCEPSLEGAGLIFVAPDAGLNLVSFAGLCGTDGRYLIEHHPLHYLSSGRDLIRTSHNAVSVTGCVAFGDPDFDATVVDRLSSAAQIAQNTIPENPYQLRNIRSGCVSFNDLKVSRLSETGPEVRSIGRFWGERHARETFQPFLGPLASEETFKKMSGGKRVIHLATHGYYLESGCLPEMKGEKAVGENPLLQSGLLLAGANLHGKGASELGGEDGVLTALEVSAMDLHGTELVVLSACETGLGKVEQGEGVYGLRRAFQMAGARTVVSSLWQVPDMESMKFMRSLYSMNSQTYPELMRKVALQRISEARLRGRPTHPFTWGAFVATGEWK